MKNSWIMLIVVMFSMDLAFCQENQTIVPKPSVLEAPLSAPIAREGLQNSYALKVARLIINAIDFFKQKYYPRVPRQEDVNYFTRELLMYGKDPLVQAVEYVPDKSLIITMQDKPPVASILRGAKLELLYNPEKNWWQIKQALPTVAARKPGSLTRDLGMEKITQYCKSGPMTTTKLFGLPDTEWCPIWLERVPD